MVAKVDHVAVARDEAILLYLQALSALLYTAPACKLVGFDLPNGILQANVNSFRMVANSAGLPSGVYVGVVQPYRLDTNQQDGLPVEVSFAL